MGEGSIKDEAWSNYTFITLTLLNLQISLLCVFHLPNRATSIGIRIVLAFFSYQIC